MLQRQVVGWRRCWQGDRRVDRIASCRQSQPDKEPSDRQGDRQGEMMVGPSQGRSEGETDGVAPRAVVTCGTVWTTHPNIHPSRLGSPSTPPDEADLRGLISWVEGGVSPAESRLANNMLCRGPAGLSPPEAPSSRTIIFIGPQLNGWISSLTACGY